MKLHEVLCIKFKALKTYKIIDSFSVESLLLNSMTLKKITFTFLFVLSLWGCSLLSSKEQTLLANSEMQNKKNAELFEKGNEALDKENYRSALRSFKSLLNEPISGTLEAVVLYNLGLSYWGLKKCAVSAGYFRKVIKISDQEHKRLRTEALLRLSYCYECLQRNALVISTLTDVRVRRRILSLEVGYAEVSARLGAAYLRENNHRVAERYFLEAESAIQKITKQNKKIKEQQELLGRTLFLMGQVTSLSNQKDQNLVSRGYVKSLKALQKYLLMAVELNHSVWSEKAADEIIQAYDLILETDASLRLRESEGSKEFNRAKALRARQNFLLASLRSIESLKTIRPPGSEKTRRMEILFTDINERNKILKRSLSKIKMTLVE